MAVTFIGEAARELCRLLDMQIEALETAAFVGLTEAEQDEYNHREQRITELGKMISHSQS